MKTQALQTTILKQVDLFLLQTVINVNFSSLVFKHQILTIYCTAPSYHNKESSIFFNSNVPAFSLLSQNKKPALQVCFTKIYLHLKKISKILVHKIYKIKV